MLASCLLMIVFLNYLLGTVDKRDIGNSFSVTNIVLLEP